MTPKLYSSLAEWWPLLSPPSGYEEEAGVYRNYLAPAAPPDAPLTLLELGSGGGDNASYLKRWFRMTLTDLSPEMLAQSRLLNPECEHVQGDMRTLRLERVFDCVFVQDAIGYMTSLDDLRQALETAFLHCRPGGVAVFAPDWVRETFRPGTDHGGVDGADRSLRYLEWVWDPDPADSQYFADIVYVLREGTGPVRIEHDRHVMGVFRRQEWLDALRDVGFEARVEAVRLKGMERPLDLFVGIRKG